MVRILSLIVVGAFLTVGSARADEFVRGDCRGVVAPSTALKYDTAEHARWYKRFWTGECDHLALCVPGGPNWNEVVGKLLAKGGSREQPALLPKACRLGQLIGLEWSREKAVRKIDTHDLRLFSSMLEASNDTLKGVDKVEQSARVKLGLR